MYVIIIHLNVNANKMSHIVKPGMNQIQEVVDINLCYFKVETDLKLCFFKVETEMVYCHRFHCALTQVGKCRVIKGTELSTSCPSR